jgi:hypothetical protein
MREVLAVVAAMQAVLAAAVMRAVLAVAAAMQAVLAAAAAMAAAGTGKHLRLFLKKACLLRQASLFRGLKTESIFTDGVECGVDQEVHATAGREAGATGSRPIGPVQAIGNQLYTNWQTDLRAGLPANAGGDYWGRTSMPVTVA